MVARKRQGVGKWSCGNKIQQDVGNERKGERGGKERTKNKREGDGVEGESGNGIKRVVVARGGDSCIERDESGILFIYLVTLCTEIR